MPKSKLTEAVLIMKETDSAGNGRYRNLASGEFVGKENITLLGRYPECVDFTSGKPTMKIKCENSRPDANALLLDYKTPTHLFGKDQKHIYLARYYRMEESREQ